MSTTHRLRRLANRPVLRPPSVATSWCTGIEDAVRRQPGRDAAAGNDAAHRVLPVAGEDDEQQERDLKRGHHLFPARAQLGPWLDGDPVIDPAARQVFRRDHRTPPGRCTACAAPGRRLTRRGASGPPLTRLELADGQSSAASQPSVKSGRWFPALGPGHPEPDTLRPS